MELNSICDTELTISGPECKFRLLLSYDPRVLFGDRRANEEASRQAAILAGYKKYLMSLDETISDGHYCRACPRSSPIDDTELWVVYSQCSGTGPDHRAFVQALDLSKDVLQHHFDSIFFEKMSCDRALDSISSLSTSTARRGPYPLGHRDSDARDSFHVAYLFPRKYYELKRYLLIFIIIGPLSVRRRRKSRKRRKGSSPRTWSTPSVASPICSTSK